MSFAKEFPLGRWTEIDLLAGRPRQSTRRAPEKPGRSLGILQVPICVFVYFQIFILHNMLSCVVV